MDQYNFTKVNHSIKTNYMFGRHDKIILIWETVWKEIFFMTPPMQFMAIDSDLKTFFSWIKYNQGNAACNRVFVVVANRLYFP